MADRIYIQVEGLDSNLGGYEQLAPGIQRAVLRLHLVPCFVPQTPSQSAVSKTFAEDRVEQYGTRNQ